MKTLLYLGIVLFSSFSLAQNSYKITYEKYSNGTLIENQDPIIVFTNEKVTQVLAKSIFENKALFPSEYFHAKWRWSKRYVCSVPIPLH